MGASLRKGLVVAGGGSSAGGRRSPRVFTPPRMYHLPRPQASRRSWCWSWRAGWRRAAPRACRGRRWPACGTWRPGEAAHGAGRGGGSARGEGREGDKGDDKGETATELMAAEARGIRPSRRSGDWMWAAAAQVVAVAVVVWRPGRRLCALPVARRLTLSRALLPPRPHPFAAAVLSGLWLCARRCSCWGRRCRRCAARPPPRPWRSRRWRARRRRHSTDLRCVVQDGAGCQYTCCSEPPAPT